MDTANSKFRLANSDTQAEDGPRFSAEKLGTFLFTLISVAMVLFGLYQRDNSYLSPADGWGYTIGIIGAVAMLLLGFYPLRKNVRFMQHWGSMRIWFKTHMMLGVIGPILVLYHCNFSLGSTNSNLALYSMLIVASSGLVGRFFFTKVHYGLYGNKATLKEMREDLKITKGNLGHQISLSPVITHQIKKYERLMLKPRMVIVNLLLLPLTYARGKLLYWNIKRKLRSDLRKQAEKNNWDKRMLNDFTREVVFAMRKYLSCVRKTSLLSTYAKLFSVWHMLHLPLFLILVVMGIIHVVVVHMY